MFTHGNVIAVGITCIVIDVEFGTRRLFLALMVYKRDWPTLSIGLSRFGRITLSISHQRPAPMYKRYWPTGYHQSVVSLVKSQCLAYSKLFEMRSTVAMSRLCFYTRQSDWSSSARRSTPAACRAVQWQTARFLYI